MAKNIKETKEDYEDLKCKIRTNRKKCAQGQLIATWIQINKIYELRKGKILTRECGIIRTNVKSEGVEVIPLWKKWHKTQNQKT